MPVYMIRAGDTDMIKIGWTKTENLEARVFSLQCGHYEKLHIIRVVDADYIVERRFHFHFLDSKIRGEWFRFTPAMLSVSVEELSPLPPRAPRIVSPRPSKMAAHPRQPKIRRKTTLVLHRSAKDRPVSAETAIVERLGGPPSVALICCVSQDTVRLWMKSTNGIPPWRRAPLVAHAEREGIPGVTYDTIQEVRRAARERT